MSRFDSVMDDSPKTVNFTISPASTNHAPVITPVSDRVVVETNLLSFQIVGTDTDLPPQTITFSLGPDAPLGAAINSSDGTFSWTPPVGLAPGTNQITVVVTDDGTPPLSATNSFNVVVIKPPRFLSISAPTDEVVTLVWESFPGKSYRLRFKEDLGSAVWTDLSGSDQVATNFTAWATNRLGPSRQRFYQVLLLD